MTAGQHQLADDAATVALGHALGVALAPVLTDHGAALQVWLDGDLGAGKTTLCRGLLTALGHRGAVKSPTYTIVEPYQFGATEVAHCDLYRLADPEELAFIGIDDYFRPGMLLLVEWPARGAAVLPAPDLTVALTVVGDGRQADLVAGTPAGARVLSALTPVGAV